MSEDKDYVKVYVWELKHNSRAAVHDFFKRRYKFDMNIEQLNRAYIDVLKTFDEKELLEALECAERDERYEEAAIIKNVQNELQNLEL